MRFIRALSWLLLCVVSAVTAYHAYGTWQAFRDPDTWAEAPGKIVQASAQYVDWKMAYAVDYKFSFSADGKTYEGVTRTGGASDLHEVRMSAESMFGKNKLEWNEVAGEDARKPNAELATKDVAVTVRYYPSNPMHSTITEKKFMRAESGWPIFALFAGLIALVAGFQFVRVLTRKKAP